MHRKLADVVLAEAIRPLMESLEGRKLLHGAGEGYLINFQPASSGVPEHYDADSGGVYGPRDGEGHVFGWTSDNAGYAIQANSPDSPDARYDTYQFIAPGNNWEIPVANGDYTVHLVAGGPLGQRSILKLDVEGVRAIDREIPRARNWVESTTTITVSDGRFTLSAGDGALRNRVAFIEITPFDEPTELGIQTAGARKDLDPGGAKFVFTRTGSVSDSATYEILIGGSARNGKDYKTILDTVTFLPGEAATAINIIPRGAAGLTGKTVTLTMLPEDDYLLAEPNAATVTIYAPQAAIPPAEAAFDPTRINFQPSGSAVPGHYAPDSGFVYGLRTNGMTYGWNADNSVNTRDRDSSLSPDQRYDTLIHLQKSGDFKWEMAVPSGTYTVRVVSGDAGFFDGVFRTNVEGVLAVNASPSSANRWVEGTATVVVSDGRLTISNATGAVNNKIAFIEINPGNTPIPVVKASATDSSASESGDQGAFTLTRTGNLGAPLTVIYTVSGSASNGADYQGLTGAATFAAGSATATVLVKPTEDTAAEGSETVTIKLSAAAEYSLASAFSGTVTISDNDVTGSLKWRSVASNPQIRAEAMGASVNGKLYTFGGYIDGTYRPTARVDVYNPATNTWARLKDMPFPGITHAGVTTDGKFVYMAGGYPGQVNAPQKFTTTDVWRYDTTNDTWTKIQSLSTGRGAGTLVRLDRTLYFMGGADTNRTDRAEAFSLDLDTPGAVWVQRASMPAPRNHVGAAALNGFIYVVGGQTAQDNATVFKADVFRYDPSTNAWTTVAPLINQPRSHTASATFAHNGKLYVLGGEGPGRIPLGNVESYDPATNKWSSLTSMPGKRSSGIGNVIGNAFIFTTGYNGTFRGETWIGEFA